MTPKNKRRNFILTKLLRAESARLGFERMALDGNIKSEAIKLDELQIEDNAVHDMLNDIQNHNGILART